MEHTPCWETYQSKEEMQDVNVLIVADIPDGSKSGITECFPPGWQISIASPGKEDAFLSDAEVIIPEHVRVDSAYLRSCPKLRMIQTGAGYDNIDLDACREKEIIVCNAAGVNAAAVAEHTIAMILCWFKNIAVLDTGMKHMETRFSYSGSELSALTIGIIGFGAVGRRVAKYCQAFDMKVLVCSPHVSNSMDLDTLLRKSDVVSLHVPLTPETRNMIGSAEFARMKKTAVLVNTSRGAVVNENDLCAALETSTIAGACLDVFQQEPLPETSPLRRMLNVLLTPHTAGYPDGPKYHRKRYLFFAENIRHLEEMHELQNRIM